MHTLIYEVEPKDEGRAIVRVIRSSMQISYRQFSKLKARGALVLDGESVHANHPVRAGQRISLCLEDEAGSGVEPEAAPVDIVFEDQDLMIVNKCAPLPCQSSPKQRGGTLENRLAHRFLAEVAWRFRPVNRLDKGTSGLMVVAKHAHAQALLTRQLHSDGFVREYLAVVCGVPAPASGTIDAPIGKADGATVRREIRPDGRSAVTHYQTLQTQNGLSLLRLRLQTGRTHQIRVHLSGIGCPVFGDFLYGREDPLLPGRFALHSCHIELTSPLTLERLALDAPLPQEISRLMG